MDSILRGETDNIRQGRTASRNAKRRAPRALKTTLSWPRRSHTYQRKQVGENPGHAPSYSAKGAPPRRKPSLKSPPSPRKINRTLRGHGPQLTTPTTKPTPS